MTSRTEDSSGLRGRAADDCLADFLKGPVEDFLVVTRRVVDFLVCMKSGIALLMPAMSASKIKNNINGIGPVLKYC